MVVWLIPFRWVYSGACSVLDLFGHGLGIDGIILVHCGAPSMSSGSFGFSLAPSGGRWVHSCSSWSSMGSFGHTLEDIVFIRLRNRWVHMGVPWRS